LAHPSISLALALALAGPAFPQAFGRFGYVEIPRWPGWEITSTGLKPQAPSSDQLRFSEPIKSWKPVQTSEIAQSSILVSGPGAPTKARFNLLSAGPSFYFTSGVQLGLGSTGSPFLSWGEGSVDAGVPTPNSKWVLLSYRDSQPPILIVFEGTPGALKITGKPGNWLVKTDGVYQGWVRFVLPLGLKSAPTNSASSLGELGNAIKPNLEVLTQPAPNLLSLDIRDDLAGIDATFRFDRPGSLVPFALQAAPIGGYPLKLGTNLTATGIELPAGPIFTCPSKELKVRFPIKRIPTGRGLGIGTPELPPLGTVSALDVPSVAELALENLTGFRDVKTKLEGERVVGQFLQEVASVKEPATGQSFLFGASGSGLDLAAAHALLMQGLSVSSQASSEGNSLLTSLVWRRDWLTWQFEGVDPLVARRASALVALAGALCPEPARRLDAAMFQAGIAAARGLAILRSRKSGTPEEKLIEPYGDVRRSLFSLAPSGKAEDLFVRQLLSEIRVFGDSSLTLQPATGHTWLRWEAGGTSQISIILAAGYPLTFENGNLAGFEVVQALGFTQLKVRATQPGPVEVKLRLPSFAKPLPAATSPPEYDESPR